MTDHRPGTPLSTSGSTPTFADLGVPAPLVAVLDKARTPMPLPP